MNHQAINQLVTVRAHACEILNRLGLCGKNAREPKICQKFEGSKNVLSVSKFWEWLKCLALALRFRLALPESQVTFHPTHRAVFTSTILINEPLQHMFCIVLSVLIHGYMIAYMSLFILGSGWRFYHLQRYPWSFIWIKNDKGTASKMIRKTWSTAGARRSGLGGGTLILM